MSHPPQHLRYTPSMENAANDVIELTMSYAVPRCLHVIAELGVADALDDTSRTAAELAMKTDEYVPTMIPHTKAKLKPCKTGPPQRNNAITVRNVSPEVITVRLRV